VRPSGTEPGVLNSACSTAAGPGALSRPGLRQRQHHDGPAESGPGPAGQSIALSPSPAVAPWHPASVTVSAAPAGPATEAQAGTASLSEPQCDVSRSDSLQAGGRNLHYTLAQRPAPAPPSQSQGLSRTLARGSNKHKIRTNVHRPVHSAMLATLFTRRAVGYFVTY
jgi:hypothetical protein